MSIPWTNRVWASSEPAAANERLLLLALADLANEEGYCWPSMGVLAARCAVDTRTVRRNMRRLEGAKLVRREIRPGRSTVYHLVARENPSAPAGRAETRAPGQGSPPEAGAQVRGGWTPAPPITHREPETSPVAALEPGGGRVTAPPARHVAPERPRLSIVKTSGSGGGERKAGPDEDLVRLLKDRGVHPPVALKLAAGYAPEHIRRYVDAYDARAASGHQPRGPGWLVAAIQDNYAIDEQEDPARLFTHREAMDWLRRNRIDLSPLNPFTRWFTTIREPGGTARFRRNAARHAHP